MVAPGDILAGRYRIESALGKGGMATVHRAVDLRLGREVAIKLLTPQRAATATVPERFLREARAMAAIYHPSIVAIFDVEWSAPGGEHGPFLVMEFVPGGTLAERIDSHGPLPPEQVVDLVDRMASALAAMHAVGLVHRDVKPQNILLGAAGPKLADLGLVRLTDRNDGIAANLTAMDITIGTLRYLAPEVLDGEPAGPAADAFALAMTAFQALTGESPRPAVTLGDLIEAAGRPARLASDVAPVLGATYDDAFAAGLALDPDQRPDVVAFATSLRAAWTRAAARAAVGPAITSVPQIDGLPDDTTVSMPTPTRPRSQGKTRNRAGSRTPWAAVAVLLLSVVGTVGFWAIGPVLLAADGPGSSGPAGATARAATSPSASPVLRATPTAQPTPYRVDLAVADLAAAIEAARGGGGLTGNRANDLRTDLDAIDQTVDKGELGKAADAAREFEDLVRESIEKDGVHSEEASRLRSAAATLSRLLSAAAQGD
jgi:serine/threonine protein kinase